jgi:hypothetical protein
VQRAFEAGWGMSDFPVFPADAELVVRGISGFGCWHSRMAEAVTGDQALRGRAAFFSPR